MNLINQEKDSYINIYRNLETFYNTFSKLEKIKRTGWLMRNINSDTLETVASHTLQVVILATTLCHELNLNFNLSKAMQMCFIHDLGEVIIGDISFVDEKYKEKKLREKEAIIQILFPLNKKTANEYLNLWIELEERKTSLAKFVYQVDKIDAVIKAKHYSKEYNCPEIFEEFYNRQLEKGTFDHGYLKDFFVSLIN